MVTPIVAIIATLLWTTHTIHIAPDKILDPKTSGAILYPDTHYGMQQLQHFNRRQND